MKKLNIILTIILLTIPAIATHAAIDPQPDGIGVYFDTEASALCHAPGGTVTCYLMLTNFTGPYLIAWTCAVDIETSLPASSMQDWFVRSGIDVDDPEDPTTWVKGFIVGMEYFTPPAGSNVVLAERQITTLSISDEVSFRVFPNQDNTPACTMCYVAMLGTDLPFHVVNGNTDVPQTFITSGDCVVANEAITWSQLKALY